MTQLVHHYSLRINGFIYFPKNYIVLIELHKNFNTKL